MEQHTQNAGNLAGALKGQDAPEALSTGEFPVQPAGKLTPREKRWIVYDVGNSAFVLLSTAVVPIYANSLLEAAGQDNIVSTWGYAQTVASLVIALLMPILGSIADVQGMKIKFFLGFFLTGVVMCLGMSLPLGWLAFLIVYVLATIGLNGSLTFYDSMLIDTTSNERMDKVSSHGYAWGYVGSTIPFIVCIAVIFGGPSLLGLDTATCTRISFLITAVWWVAFTVPLLRSYRQVHYRTTADHTAEAVRGTFRELAGTFRRIARDRSLLLFMIAFFFYIDAVNTVISMSTSYGTQLGIDSTQLVIALLVTQFVAFPCAILYGRLAGRFGAKRMIVIAVIAYLGIVMFAAFFLKTAVEFWILAILVGMFQGGIQALSRSYYGKIIPKDHANEYYGFYDIFGKTASVLGTFLVATTTAVTGNASAGVLSIAVLLVAALVLLLVQKDPTA
ncbi:MFS, major facilitator superfamily protein [Bifidobacterium pullorum subsp. saeculare DSM 6531 = LMG 14934]|uniref:MFS, major facilitator superfamily protein n=1 Tax=Bifidobacterium pullorum subsp. saeculare DSM 6531 = LMG 14934 TaxID=1437611 RepID=A0A087CZG9_9BIFI|nr:MFS transporter [Bifidobacterium pullorum]KFI88669.1 MFS, major facilitator superfamily protein [Bifidobacterium pullorum subsp. saeculare DSM 6531 = LMG 14934]